MTPTQIDSSLKWVDLTIDDPYNIHWKADLIDV
jgi:hypothetical protein